jgi:hypothetical protein
VIPGDAVTIAYSEWSGTRTPGEPLSAGGFSPTVARSEKSSSFCEESPRGNHGPRRPSAEAVARRRKQNRVSQAAWRARNKELVEELRQEISECSEYNQGMHQTMQALLKTTESLKGAIESALAQKPPRSSQDYRHVNNGEMQLMSPRSSNGDARPEQEEQAREE